MCCEAPSTRQERDLLGSDVTEVRECRARCEPSPLVEEFERAPTVVTHRSLHIDLFVGLSPASQVSIVGDVSHQSKCRLTIAVHACRPQGDLHEAVFTHPAACGCQLGRDRIGTRGRGFRVAARRAAHEDDPRSQLTCGSLDRSRDVDSITLRGPAEVMIGNGGDAAQQRLRDTDPGGCVGGHGSDSDSRVRLRHTREPIPHRHASRSGQSAEKALEQMVVSVYQPRCDNTSGYVDRLP